MLKKVAITGAASAVALLCLTGVAHADSANPNCSSHETTKQENKGKQLVGGNVNVTDINGIIGGEIDKAAVCPSVLNNNKLHHSDDSDD